MLPLKLQGSSRSVATFVFLWLLSQNDSEGISYNPNKTDVFSCRSKICLYYSMQFYIRSQRIHILRRLSYGLYLMHSEPLDNFIHLNGFL